MNGRGDPCEPLETVSFLASSANRVRILEAVAAGPVTRADLAEECDVARSTLGRILAELTSRGWVYRNGATFEATPRGRHLARSLRALLDTVAVLEIESDVLSWFHVEDVTFDVGRLASARITRPNRQDGLRPVTRSLALLEDADDVTLVAAQHAPPALEAMWTAAVIEEDQTLELVLTDDVLATVLADQTDADRLRDLVAAEAVTVRCGADDRGYNVGTIDGTVVFALNDDRGAPQALVETDDPVVGDWFQSTLAALRSQLTPLGPADLPA